MIEGIERESRTRIWLEMVQVVSRGCCACLDIIRDSPHSGQTRVLAARSALFCRSTSVSDSYLQCPRLAHNGDGHGWRRSAGGCTWAR